MKCYLCSGDVIWQSDFMFDECGYEGDGIVSLYTCKKCGADIEARKSIETEEEEDEN